MKADLRRALALALAIVIVVVIGRPARAETSLEVTTAPVTSEVALGADIDVDVRVKNASASDMDLPALTFDARSVSFELVYEGGHPAWDAQFHVDMPHNTMQKDPLTPIKRSVLKAGESWSQRFTIPAIAAGSWQIKAVYAGTTDPEPRFLSQLVEPTRLNRVRDATAKTVKVLTGPNGETQVVCKMTVTPGTFTMKFFPKDALATALNFVRVCQRGDYDGKVFFRNAADLEILQGGADNGGSFSGTRIPLEQRLRHGPLRVGMAREDAPNTAGVQFYICYGPASQKLDRPDGYAIFGEIVKGKDVVETMAQARSADPKSPTGSMPTTKLVIEGVKIQLAPKE
jgi:cyclophilin family peptidyl-prolyl cis-trans isomerase